MLVDCHSHLDDDRLTAFLESFENGASAQLAVISNSVDVESSRLNLDLAGKSKSVYAFVGIHPEFLIRPEAPTDIQIGETLVQIKKLSERSSGIGEIGLDPKYGKMGLQRSLFEGQLGIAESNPRLGISLHSRDTIKEILDTLSTYRLRNPIMFHWFSGSIEDLRVVNSRGYYVSFGLPSLYSKRIANLVRFSEESLLLAETDSPANFRSVSEETITPFHISSVIFSMSSIRGVSFEEMCEINEINASKYLKRKAD